MTNGDFIRSMSDEEIAELFTWVLSEQERLLIESVSNQGIRVELVECLPLSYNNHLQWIQEEMSQDAEE